MLLLIHNFPKLRLHKLSPLFLVQLRQESIMSSDYLINNRLKVVLVLGSDSYVNMILLKMVFLDSELYVPILIITRLYAFSSILMLLSIVFRIDLYFRRSIDFDLTF